MRASEFITEGKGLRGGTRADATKEFQAAHPGLVSPAGRGDMYVGRYYDFYRVASLIGMDPDELDKVDDISFFGNLPVFSAYTEHDREKLKKVMKKLGMNPQELFTTGKWEMDDTNLKSPINAFKGYKR
jgi:hypothetical protein